MLVCCWLHHRYRPYRDLTKSNLRPPTSIHQSSNPSLQHISTQCRTQLKPRRQSSPKHRSPRSWKKTTNSRTSPLKTGHKKKPSRPPGQQQMAEANTSGRRAGMTMMPQRTSPSSSKRN